MNDDAMVLAKLTQLHLQNALTKYQLGHVMGRSEIDSTPHGSFDNSQQLMFVNDLGYGAKC